MKRLLLALATCRRRLCRCQSSLSVSGAMTIAKAATAHGNCPAGIKANHARKYSRSMSSTSLMVDCPANPFVSAYVKTPAPVAHPYTAVVTAGCVPDGGSFDPPGAGHLPLRALHRQPLAEEHERQRLTQHADE